MKKRWWLLFVLFLPFLFVQVGEAYAGSTVKDGLAEKVEGDVFFQKGASFKKIPLKGSQTLRPGDLISTGKNASVEIYMQGTGDKFYVGENSEVSFMYKDESLFFHVLKGKVYVVAEKRETAAESLYIVSEKQKYKVLGTQFLVEINPSTGLPTLFVSSGVVEARSTGGQRETNIYPGQSYNPTNPTPLPIDPLSFTNQSDPAIIQALITNYRKAAEENAQLYEGLVGGDVQAPDFPTMSVQELERYKSNLDALTARLVDEAINKGRVDEEEIKKIIEKVNEQGGPQLNLDDAHLYNPDVSAAQRAAQEAAERRRQAQEKREQEALQRLQERQLQQILKEAEQRKQMQQEQLLEEQKKMIEENRKRLEEQRRPAPTPSPKPTPKPEKLEVGAEVGPFAIDLFWEHQDNYAYYEMYLDGNLIDTITETNYQFTELRPGRGYDLMIKVYDKNNKIIALYEGFGEKTTTDYEPIDMTTGIDDYLYIHINNDEKTAENSYEVWINDQQISFEFTENPIILDMELLKQPINTIEVFSFNSSGEKIGYASSEVEIELGENELERISLMGVNPTSTYLYWDWYNPDSSDHLTVELYEENKTGELLEVIAYDPGNAFWFIQNLSPSTKYIVVEKLYGIEINRISFETMPEGWIDYTDETVSWGGPSGENISYKVYINGQEVTYGKDSSYKIWELLNEIDFCSGEELPMEDCNLAEWTIKVVIFEEEEERGEYTSTFINLPLSIPH